MVGARSSGGHGEAVFVAMISVLTLASTTGALEPKSLGEIMGFRALHGLSTGTGALPGLGSEGESAFACPLHTT